MDKQALMVEVLALPPEERMDLIEAAWDSLAAAPQVLPLEDWQKEELQRRLKAFEADPQGRAWKDVLERIRAK